MNFRKESPPSLEELTAQQLALQRKRTVPIPLRLVVALASLIAVGTVLLLLPGMTTEPIGIVDALFTSTSASAVTGFGVVTTSTAFTRMGQWVILLLMEFGGLGFLVTTVLTLRLLGRHVSLADRLAVSSSLGLASPRAIFQVLTRTVVLMLVVEGIGALILAVHWWRSGIVPADQAAFYGLFHAVAAFCNAGFDLFVGLPQYPDGLPADPVTLLTLGWLIIIGGLGIPVYMELLHRRTARAEGGRLRRLSLHTRLVLWSAVVLVLVGWVGILLGEYKQAGVLSDLPLGERLLRSWFQSVAARSAGFTGLADFSNLHDTSRLLLIFLMFIGGAPASMGGGITTGTFAVLVLAMWSLSRGYNRVHAGQRSISMGTVWRAVTVLIVSLLVVTFVTWLLLLTQDLSLSETLFEVVSAFSTTGLSLGVLGKLDGFGRLVMVALMFWGRLGAVTIVLILLKRPGQPTLKEYPEEIVLVG